MMKYDLSINLNQFVCNGIEIVSCNQLEALRMCGCVDV